MPLPSVTPHDVLWTDFVNTRVETSNLLRCIDTNPTEWAGGAGSVQSFVSGVDAYVQHTARTNGQPVIVGLTNGNPNGDWATVDYGWYTDGAGGCSVNERGAGGIYTGSYADGDLMQVVWASGFIHYYQNGSPVAVGGSTPTFPLVFDCSIQNVGGTVEGALICADTLTDLRPAPIYFGQDYTGNQNQPQGLRVVMAIDTDLGLVDVTDEVDYQVDRRSMRITRSNQDASNAVASFDITLPNGSFFDVPANRYVAIYDPHTPNGLGGSLAYFAGYTDRPTPQQPAGEERKIGISCVDYGVLTQKPPKQIVTQWPPGDGTPVVNTNVADSIAAGTRTITPVSMRHIYVGKRLIAENSDGSNRETITVTAVTDTTFDAVFASSKTSSTATVPGALHATGVQTITPDSMTNIGVGSLLYCQKHHGDQTVGNEYVVVSAITSTTFDAFFQYWKTHDWTVTNNWVIRGGVSDKELIADGFKMSIDTVDATTGVVTTALVDIPSLLDYCYNNEGFSMDKSAVEEVITSLPHGAWTGASPADVLKWVTAQNPDDTKQPRWYMSFVQPTAPTPTTLTPMLRYYDAKASAHLAPIVLTNQIAQIDTLTQARWKDTYTYQEDGGSFANKQSVIGDLNSEGSWQDDDSIGTPGTDNYVGRVIEAPVVTDNTVTTNDEASARAASLASQKQLSIRQKSISVTTAAQLDPRVIYEPQIVTFDAIFEPAGPVDMEVRTVTLSFDSDDLANYAFQLGLPQNPARFYEQGTPGFYREASVRTGRGGRVVSVGPQSTRYVSEHTQLTGDATLYVADTSDQAVSLYLPRASYYPGLPVRVRVPSGASNNATVHAYQRDGVLDTIDGANTMDVSPGQGIILQSAGEHDVRGHGAVWHQVGNMAGATGTPWLLGGNAPGVDSVFGTQDDFDISIIRNNVEVGHIYLNETDTYQYTYFASDDSMSTAGADFYFQQRTATLGGRYAIGAHTQVMAATGSLDVISGIKSTVEVGSSSDVSIASARGLDGFVALGGGAGQSAALAASIFGRANTLFGTAGAVVDKAVSIYGETQTIGTENWSGYFEGDLYIGGKLVGTNQTINLPISTGDVPTVGFYISIIADFASTIKAVRVLMKDASGDRISDTCTLNVWRTPFASGAKVALNPSAFGPSAADNFETTDPVGDGWTVDLDAHDSLQAELVSAPTSAVEIEIALEVVRA